MSTATVLRSIGLFIAAGLLEIGGGYLVWLWLRESRAVVLGVFGGFLLFLYGVLPTFQPAHFGRVYAAYGGVFVVLSLLWGVVDRRAQPRPGRRGGCDAVRGGHRHHHVLAARRRRVDSATRRSSSAA